MSKINQLANMLKRKEEIDAMKGGGVGWSGGEGRFVMSQRWLADAVELLLRIEVERQQGNGLFGT